MHIIQFWRMLWARRLLVLVTTLSCLAGGIVLCSILPPRYESTARVMLGLLKPDPMTGEMIGGSTAGAYIATQMALVTDYNVAVKVVDALGWSSDPNLLAAYAKRNKKDQRDFQHWAAERVIQSTKAKLVEGSNILEISYTASRPQDAKAVAEVLQQGYLDTSVALKREDAAKQAAWFEDQAEQARVALNKAEDEKSQFERANGVMMQDDKQDIESARLQVLTMQGTQTAPIIPPAIQTSPTAIELAQIDAAIVQQSKILGPNHPDLQALRERRKALAAIVEKDQEAQRKAMGALAEAANSGAAALQQAIEKQKDVVIKQSDKLERLKQLQAEVNLRREQLEKSTTAAAAYQEQAGVVNTGLSPLGPATMPSSPSFPNMLLIVPGTIVLGLGLGSLMALMIEVLLRRIRGVEDLASLDGVSVLAVIPRRKRATKLMWRPQNLLARWRRRREAMAPA